MLMLTIPLNGVDLIRVNADMLNVNDDSSFKYDVLIRVNACMLNVNVDSSFKWC